jgi:hypothetical protein
MHVPECVPSSELGPPTPFYASECVSSLGPKGGGATLPSGTFGRMERKPGTLYTLFPSPCYPSLSKPPSRLLGQYDYYNET